MTGARCRVAVPLVREGASPLEWATEIEPYLRTDEDGELLATTLMDELCRRHPEGFKPGQVRTLQRQIWCGVANLATPLVPCGLGSMCTAAGRAARRADLIPQTSGPGRREWRLRPRRA
jgi:hypothetical protein